MRTKLGLSLLSFYHDYHVYTEEGWKVNRDQQRMEELFALYKKAVE
ncbi:hypothetical protein [Lentibacillus sp.]|nr:hypothetical protein [Lentibacillus sp.]HLS10190.1 hypothetical protein [Lentibacillus sp.]